WQVKQPASRELQFPQDFELVAEVFTQDPDTAFSQTNSAEYPWWSDERVMVHKKARSSSSGDVVVTPDGMTHLRLPVGWKSYDERPATVPAVGFALAWYFVTKRDRRIARTNKGGKSWQPGDHTAASSKGSSTTRHPAVSPAG